MKIIELQAMKLQITGVHNGSKTDEHVGLRVLQDCDLGDYAIADNTFSEEGDLSNKHVHIFRFPSTKAKTGDLVFLHTGKAKKLKTPEGETRHRFFWNLSTPVWNNDGDRAILLHISQTAAASVPPQATKSK
jgi:hypothetical protein